MSKGKRFCNDPSTDEIRETYQKLNDPVKLWIDENSVTGTQYDGKKDEIHSDFIAYCWKRKISPIELIALGRELAKFGIKDKKTTGQKREHVWAGIYLKKNHEQQSLNFSEAG